MKDYNKILMNKMNECTYYHSDFKDDLLLIQEKLSLSMIPLSIIYFLWEIFSSDIYYAQFICVNDGYIEEFADWLERN